MNYEVLSYEVGTLMAKSFIEDKELFFTASSILRCFETGGKFIKKEMEVGIVTELLNTMNEIESKATLPQILEMYKEDLEYLYELDNFNELEY